VQHIPASNRCSPSTTWHWKDGRLAPGAHPACHAGAPLASVARLRARDPRKPLDLQIRYLGGGSPLFEVIARGWRWKVDGTLALLDVMNWVNRCDT